MLGRQRHRAQSKQMFACQSISTGLCSQAALAARSKERTDGSSTVEHYDHESCLSSRQGSGAASLQQALKEGVISGHCLAQRCWGAKQRGEGGLASTPVTFVLTQLCQPPLVSTSVTLLAPARPSGPAKVPTHVGLFVFSGAWDKGADSPISYLTKQSPNTFPERRTGNNPREQGNIKTTWLPVSQGKAKHQYSLRK